MHQVAVADNGSSIYFKSNDGFTSVSDNNTATGAVAIADTILSEAATNLGNSICQFKARQAVAYSASANLAAAAARIEDTDYAQECNLAKSSIMNQSAMAMVAQANQANAAFLTIINQ